MNEKKLVKCKCGYEWHTKSKKKNVSCPNCLGKVKIVEVDSNV